MATNPMDLAVTVDDHSELGSEALSSPSDRTTDASDCLSIPPTPTAGMPDSEASRLRGYARLNSLPLASVNPSVTDGSEMDRKRAIEAEERARKAEMEALAAKQREDEMRKKLEKLEAEQAERAKQESLNRAQQEALQRRLQEEQRMRIELENRDKERQRIAAEEARRRAAEELARQEALKVAERQEAVRKEALRVDAARQEAARQEALRIKEADEKKRKEEEIRIARVREQYYGAKKEFETKHPGAVFSIRCVDWWWYEPECKSLLAQLPATDPAHKEAQLAEARLNGRKAEIIKSMIAARIEAEANREAARTATASHGRDYGGGGSYGFSAGLGSFGGR